MAFWCVLFSLATASAAPLLAYDRGDPGVVGSARTYTDATACVDAHPCEIDHYAAFRLGTNGTTDDVHFWVLHGTFERPILLFQHAEGGPHPPAWLLTHRSRNDVVVNFDAMFDAAADKPPTLFVYGMDLRYHFDNDDLLYTEIHDGTTGELHRYYFRYWARGRQSRVGVTTILPVAIWSSNPDLRARLSESYVNVALSFMLYKNLEPDHDYTWARRAFNGVQPTVLVGVLSQLALQDKYVVTKPDLFVGGGLTLLRCVHVGAGITLLQTPRGAFPYVGVHVDELVQLLDELSSTPTRKWMRYQKAEQEAQ